MLPRVTAPAPSKNTANAQETITLQNPPRQVKGIIYPPPDIRAIVDKTARFVAKNGKSFEERIQASEEGKSAKFNFMRPHDPYYAYYEFKIRDFEENGDAPKPAVSAVDGRWRVDFTF